MEPEGQGPAGKAGAGRQAAGIRTTKFYSVQAIVRCACSTDMRPLSPATLHFRLTP